MVAMNEHGKKNNVPALELRKPVQQKRSRQAVLRRKLRKELGAQFVSAGQG